MADLLVPFDVCKGHRSGWYTAKNPCKRCGSKTRTSNRQCVPCKREDSKQRAKLKRENPDHLKNQAEYRKKNAVMEKVYQRRSDYKKKFGITVDQYEHMLIMQNGVCAICHHVCVTGRNLAVDHCHETGKIRGLLCANCNRGIGMFKDMPNRLKMAAKYLELS